MGRKKSVAKHRKWRKADIGDVEDALEDERLVRKMKSESDGVVGKKRKNSAIEAEDLFTIDTKGSFDGISNSSRRELAKAKLFPKKGPNVGMSSSEIVKISRAENKVEVASRPKAKPAPEVYDLWAAPASSAKSNGSTEFARLRRAVRPEVQMPSTLHQKVGLAPAVLPAHEGQSMNPQRAAYEDLTYMAAAVEIEKEHDAEEVERKMRPMTSALREAVGAARLKEMDEEEKFALYRSLMQSQATKDAANDEGETAPGGRKTKAWKQKAKALKNRNSKSKRDLGAKEEQARSQQLLAKSVGEVGSMLKDMKEKDELHKSRREYKESMRRKRKELEATEGVVPKHRKLGSGRFAEEAQLLPDCAAAAKGLRAMPLKTSAVKERLSSIMRRGLLPAANESSKEQRNRHKKRSNRQNNKRKFISPLLKDNLLLR